MISLVLAHLCTVITPLISPLSTLIGLELGEKCSCNWVTKYPEPPSTPFFERRETFEALVLPALSRASSRGYCNPY